MCALILGHPLYRPPPPCVFMVWYLIKHRDDFPLTVTVTPGLTIKGREVSVERTVSICLCDSSCLPDCTARHPRRP
jgi:hypothetical protein